ncbi:hypothetical protein B0H13DRAFT_54413 [Mycena leptocephala]|nr:hypothetical protein B0H13DRAFT_54413 [Mycena leptocephala]
MLVGHIRRSMRCTRFMSVGTIRTICRWAFFRLYGAFTTGGDDPVDRFFFFSLPKYLSTTFSFLKTHPSILHVSLSLAFFLVTYWYTLVFLPVYSIYCVFFFSTTWLGVSLLACGWICNGVLSAYVGTI